MSQAVEPAQALASARTAAAIDALRRYWRGREVLILLPEFTAAARTIIGELADCGAEVTGVLTAAHPAADAPAVRHLWSFADHGYQLTPSTFDLMLREPPAELADWLSAVDPGRSLLALGGTFTHVDSLCGRQVHGWRRPEWAAWEDKTRIESLWREAGVPSPPHAVLPVGDPALPDIMIRLDRGLGVVLALDSTRGFLGDSTGLRWVRNPREPAGALAWCQGKTDRLRVAAFVPGVPCSVLGMVLADGVAVFDPIEIVTLRDPARDALVFCGSSTWWRPGAQAADLIRRHARSAGARLAAFGFRGMFSVDGILNGNDFRATELNPRHASGLGLRAGWPRFPGYLFQRAMQEGMPGVFDLPCHAVEEEFRTTVRGHPSYSVRVPLAASSPAASSPAASARLAGGSRHILDLATATFPYPVVQTVAYHRGARSARVLSIDPPLPEGLAAPAAAALATALGPTRLTSCRDDVRRAPSPRKAHDEHRIAHKSA